MGELNQIGVTGKNSKRFCQAKTDILSGEHIKVIVKDPSSHPHCLHGPTLLFQRTFDNSNRVEEFFACSACRNRKECSFYLEESKFKPKPDEICAENGKSDRSVTDDREKIRTIDARKRVFCHTCGLFVLTCIADHESHDLQVGISNECLVKPTMLLRPLSNDQREAQYFFTESTLQCFASLFHQLHFNKIICIGAPRLHEYLKCNKTNFKIQSVLLDFDKRFQSFYDSSEYWHYNMFNHHFFGGSKAKTEFQLFIKEAVDANEQCCVVTDPPFGCRTEPLASTIEKLSIEYREINDFRKLLPIFWVFPYYMENYIQAVMPQLEMLDYKVNYTNHSTYHDRTDGRKQGSPVRIFSNINLKLIRFPSVENYRFCSKCQRPVASENVHCNKCKRCPSKNGSTYIHCELCETCVKPSYKHCDNCGRCTQVQGHECIAFQKNLTCFICRRKGHNEINCVKWLELSHRKSISLSKLFRNSIKKRKKLCLVCVKVGHNELNCTKRKELLQEEKFMGTFSNVLNKNVE